MRTLDPSRTTHGWTEVLSGSGGITDIAAGLAILTAFAAALLGLAALRLRHSLTA